MQSAQASTVVIKNSLKKSWIEHLRIIRFGSNEYRKKSKDKPEKIILSKNERRNDILQFNPIIPFLLE